jgi:hypothetical protein
MLNDVLAVCVAGAVVVVIATILGAVEQARLAVIHTLKQRPSPELSGGGEPERSRTSHQDRGR